MGYNARLVVTADVITSSTPTDTVSDLADAIRTIPGVVAVPEPTPQRPGRGHRADPGDPRGRPERLRATADLVTELRAQAPALEKKYGVSTMLVTGQTAANIDASDRLGEALLPFGAIVIGLSLILLMVVFRSIAVPIKATLGYLLSVGAALGAVVVVFQWGWFDALTPGLSDGPVVSFLPIFVMGVLFGLAMDYEMFLVSAMREHYVLTGDRRESVVDGFRASSRVVTAAALIMTSVFVAFIPGGPATIKQIALGTGRRCLRRRLPRPDDAGPGGAGARWVGGRGGCPAGWTACCPSSTWRGAALHRKVAFDDYQAEHGPTTLLARDVVVPGNATPVQASAESGGGVDRLAVPDGEDPGAVGRVLAGRRPAAAGEVVVGGLLLPEQREAVIRRTALLEAGHPGSLGGLGHGSGARPGSPREPVRPPTGRADRAGAAAGRRARGSGSSARRGWRRRCSGGGRRALGLSSGVDVFVFSGLDGQPRT